MKMMQRKAKQNDRLLFVFRNNERKTFTNGFNSVVKVRPVDRSKMDERSSMMTKACVEFGLNQRMGDFRN